MKVYLRADPLMDERKSHYSPSQFGAFVKIWLFLGRGKDPGRYHGSVDDLRRALPAGYARHVGFLVAQGDLVQRGDVLYFDGWDEWQEGDLTVRERVARLRARRKKGGDVTPDVTPSSVTKPPEHPPFTYATSTSTLKRDVPDILLPPSPDQHLADDDQEDVRLRAEGQAGGSDRPPDLDPLFELLTQIGLFERSPNHRRQTARQLRVWGYDLEDVARAWQTCSTALSPVAAFARAAQEPGRFKALVARAGPPPRAPRSRAAAPPAFRPNLLDGFGPPPARRDPPPRVELPGVGNASEHEPEPVRGAMKYTDESYMGMGRESDRPDTPRDEVPPLPGARRAPNPMDGIARPAGWRSEAMAQVDSVSRVFARLPKRAPLWTLEADPSRQRVVARVAMEAVRNDLNPERAVAAALATLDAAARVREPGDDDDRPAPRRLVAVAAADVPEHDEEF